MLRALLAALMLCAMTGDVRSQTAVEKAACTPDAFKLCWREFWSTDVRANVFSCLKKHHHKGDLSAECEAVFRVHGL